MSVSIPSHHVPPAQRMLIEAVNELNGVSGKPGSRAVRLSELQAAGLIAMNESGVVRAGKNLDALQLKLLGIEGEVTGFTRGYSGLVSSIGELDGKLVLQTQDLTALRTKLEFFSGEGENLRRNFAANSEAVQALTSRIEASENRVEVLSQETTNLLATVTVGEGTLSFLNEGVVANAEANQLLEARVTVNEGTITAHSQFITDLQADLTTLQGDVVAQGSAIDTLETQVTANTNGITSISNRTTTLENAVNHPTTGLAAHTAAINTLDSRVDATELGITANSSSITGLTARIGDSPDNLVKRGIFDAAHLDTGNWTGGGNTTVQVNAGNARGYAMRLSAVASGAYEGWGFFPLVAGETFDIEADVFLDSLTSGYVVMGIHSRNADGSNASFSYAQWDGLGTNQLTNAAINGWTRVKGLVTVAAGVEGRALIFLLGSPAGDFFVNNIKLTRRNRTVETTAAAVTSLEARVTSVEGVNTAQATSITSLNSTVAGKADVSALTALTTRVTTVEQAGENTNLLVNSTFTSAANPSRGWVIGGGTGWSALTKNLAGVSWHPLGIDTIGANKSGLTPPNSFVILDQRVPVEPGKRYMFSAYVATHRGRTWIEIAYLDAAGNIIAGYHFATNILASDASIGAGAALSAWTRYHQALNAAPSNARTVLCRWVGDGDNKVDPYCWMCRPMLEVISATQTTPSPWNAGGTEAFASYALTLNVNGYVSGWEFVNDGTTGNFTINADTFRVIKPGGGNYLNWEGAAATLQMHNAATNVDLILGPAFGADADKLIFFYGSAPASVASATMAGAAVGIAQSGKLKLAGANTNMTAGWDSGAVATATYDSGSPDAAVTINVTAGVFRSSGMAIPYNASSGAIGQPRSTTVVYHLYYSDAGMAGGAKALGISTDYRKTYDNPNNVYIGKVSVTIPAAGSGTGGTGGKVECPLQSAWVIRRGVGGEEEFVVAGEVREGDHLLLTSGRWGRVSQSRPAMAPAVRVVGQSGFSISCSKSAPLGTDSGQPVKAAKANGAVILARSALISCDRVGEVEDLGEQWVQHITCEDDFFWVGDDPLCLFSHHNLKNG